MTTNLLASPRGRLLLFALLYFGEGLPQGFVSAAVVLEFKRMGMNAEALGTFAATAMAPWAWKWLVGPFVDNLHWPRFGRRTQWIVLAQVGMIASLLAALSVFPADIAGLGLFTTLLVVHNLFGATQDVAIDALAVGALPDDERGRANGVMFAAAQLGMAAGGSGVIALKGELGFGVAALLVPTCLVVILSTMLRAVREGLQPAPTTGLGAVVAELRDYGVTVVRTFFTTRRGFLGLCLALLPAGCLTLSLTLSNAVTPTLGMTDDEIATLGFASSMVFAVACLAGGALSDRIGRRLALALFAGSTALPTAGLAWHFHAAGFLSPPTALADGTWPRNDAMIQAWVLASLVFAIGFGMMYGVRSALYMDIAEPRIAATQFTASMALLNLVIMYSYWWQGQALTAAGEGGWGWTLPQTLAADAAFGLIFIGVLVWLPTRGTEGDAPSPA